MSAEDIPVETLRELLDQAESIEDQSFTVHRTFTVRITGNVTPDGGVAVVDNVHVSASADQSDDLSDYVGEAIHEAIEHDSYLCHEIETALTEVTDQLEVLLMDLADVESEYDLETGTLVCELEDKTGIPLS